jgi:hypothetical protein
MTAHPLEAIKSPGKHDDDPHMGGLPASREAPADPGSDSADELTSDIEMDDPGDPGDGEWRDAGSDYRR